MVFFILAMAVLRLLKTTSNLKARFIEKLGFLLFQNIFILRMLLLSETDPFKWDRINQLMDHRDERFKGKL